MPERDADKMAGKPERYRRVGGGTAESTAGAHQTGAACWMASFSDVGTDLSDTPTASLFHPVSASDGLPAMTNE